MAFHPMGVAAATQAEVCSWAAADASYEVSRIDGIGAAETYLCVRPRGGAPFQAQVEQAYARLAELLRDQGASPAHVVSERAYLCAEADVERVRRVRAEFYGLPGQPGPASTYLRQPPCREAVALELQARVAFPAAPGHDVSVCTLEAALGAGAARCVSSRGYDHLYAHNITGGQPGDGRDCAAQLDSAFERAEALLESRGLTFRDVIRTWIYLPHMERDYDDLNRVRTAFFERVGIERLPASTGIQGGVWPGDRLGCLDLYALGGDAPRRVCRMQAPTLNEAWTYGSAFSRGLEVTREDRTVLYVSGTASIDECGRVVSVGAIEGQVQRMLTNIEALLAGSRAVPSDLVRATTFLKRAEFLDAFLSGWRRRGFPTQIPHTICRADVCRPDWLCETEVAAVFPPRPARPR